MRKREVEIRDQEIGVGGCAQVEREGGEGSDGWRADENESRKWWWFRWVCEGERDSRDMGKEKCRLSGDWRRRLGSEVVVGALAAVGGASGDGGRRQWWKLGLV